MKLEEKLRRMMWLMHSFVHRNHMEMGLADSSRGQGRVLALLKMQPEITTKDLAYLLGIRSQSLNELLGKLEKSGLIIRSANEDDKRKVTVKLTEKGQKEKQEETPFSDLFNCLNEQDQEKFGEYLDKIITELESKVGKSADEDFEWFSKARERFGKNFEKIIAMRHGRHRDFNDRFHGFRGEDNDKE